MADSGTKEHRQRLRDRFVADENVLIDAQQVSVECFRLNDKGVWELHPYTEGNEIHLTSVNFHCPISLLYEDVQLSTEA